MKHSETPETAETVKHPERFWYKLGHPGTLVQPVKCACSSQSGMSSAGLLVVVIVATVTVVVMATAIPSLLKSRDAGQPTAVTAKLKAGEAGVLAGIRAIMDAENTYVLGGSSENIGTLQELRAAGLLDSAFTDSGTRGGYRYAVSVGTSGHTYCITAVRASSADGDLAYSVSQYTVIYQMAGDTAPSCDPNTGLITSGTIMGR